MKKQNNWEEEFDKNWDSPMGFVSMYPEKHVNKDAVKSFIRTVEEKAREEERKRIFSPINHLKAMASAVSLSEEEIAELRYLVSLQSLNK